MPRYRFTAISVAGTISSGVRVAVSLDELRQRLAMADMRLVRARPALGERLRLRKVRARPENFLLLVHELLALVRAGLPIPEALRLASKRPEDPALGKALQQVLAEVRGGALFSQACAQQADTFEPLFIAAVTTGEKTGDLITSLARYQDYLKQRIAMGKKLAQALVYPLFLLITLAVVMAALFLFVMPRFAAMYADFDTPLPAPTRFLMAVTQHLPYILTVIAGLGALAWVLSRPWRASDRGRLMIERLCDSLPYVGNLRKVEAVAMLARSLSAMLAGGTPLANALKAAQQTATRLGQQQRIGRVLQRVTGGESLARAVATAGLLPETAGKMIEVGEATGKLDAMFAEIAQYYDGILEQRLSRVVALIEPLMMLLMGVLIGGIIIVMYLPIFNLAAVIQ